jgi:ribonuclease P protein component
LIRAKALVSFKLIKQAKIVKTDDFSSVFSLRKRIASPHLVMRYKPNDLNRPRLGLIVGKKTAKLAVWRNYMKRVLRELFRINQHQLPALDLVIQVQKPFEKADFLQIKQEFEQLMLKLATKTSEIKTADKNVRLIVS